MPGLPAQQTLQFRSLRNNARELVLRVAAEAGLGARGQ
eukprot:CAMPEP_0179010280 /NCGR_PEP_ID=MMETSP0796-20121207/19_1 /TAXON_ID=73915 /ORGANISM="Pyrodinium bahamense, Strain pbaha01" /LENGTH=37 /DNA_ID= /DNA_START= /DNA_END= /DNA_ORIENTATION=